MGLKKTENILVPLRTFPPPICMKSMLISCIDGLNAAVTVSYSLRFFYMFAALVVIWEYSLTSELKTLLLTVIL